MWYWNSNQGRVFSPSSGKHIFRIDILYFRATNVENHKFCIFTATTNCGRDIHSLPKSIKMSKYSYTTEYNQIPMNMKLTTKEPTSFSKLTDRVW